jgi:CubicO group peptidase (beta-lactamase class C family)
VLAALPLQAQDNEVPWTRTLPGIASPTFPNARPEEVGLSSGKLERLGDEITWVANGDLVGGELLIIKGGRAEFHEAYGWADREQGRPLQRNSLAPWSRATWPI